MHPAKLSTPVLWTIVGVSMTACDEGQSPTVLYDVVAAAEAFSAVPIMDMGNSLTYLGFAGGLYPGGDDAIPQAHLDNRPTVNGTIVLFSIGMSNTAMEFCASGTASQACTSESFTGQADADADVNPTLLIVNGAQNSRPADRWLSSSAGTWETLVDAVEAVASIDQAQVCWLKQANHDTSDPVTLPADDALAYDLVADLGAILRNAKARFANLRQCYLSSRIYAGYAGRGGSIEPAAYETGFAVKWVVEAQINQLATGAIDARAGDLGLDVAPWVAWGPYLWADGANPRSDGLVWLEGDYRQDFIHPSSTGVEKVGSLLLDFFKMSPATMDWFLESGGGEPPANNPPTASFSASCTDLTCDFTDTSTDSDGTIASWNWDLGDGNTSTAQSPSHTYGSAGTVTVTLTVTDHDGDTDTASLDVTVSEAGNAPPTASFTSSCTDLTCDFTDTSTDSDGTIASWNWDLGDGNTSTAQSPSHTYGSAGTVTVTLTVTDDDGDTDTASQDVTVSEAGNAPPMASFSASCTDLTCDFTDTSTDSDGTIASWSWNFGDGNTSTAQSPSHTYSSAGTFTVTLTATDDAGATDSESQDVTVSEPSTSDIKLPLVPRERSDGFKRTFVIWDGAASADVDIYRDGVLITTTDNDGLHADNIGTSAQTSFIYQVCEAGTSTCSLEVTANF